MINQNSETREKRKYTVSDKVSTAKQKQFNISSVNLAYWNAFRDSKWAGMEERKGSAGTYRATIFNLMEAIPDLIELTLEQLQEYVADTPNEVTRANKVAHIKSILTYIIQNNVDDCRERVSKETLLMIISI